MKHPVLAFCAGLAFSAFLPGGGARADATLNCDAYAGAAVAQNQVNVAAGCSLTGGRWSDDFDGHRNWCLQPNVRMENVTAEDGARRAALAQCAARPAMDQQACQTYADDAVMAADAATRQSCGFQGGRWLTDFGAHFKWCLGVPQSARDQEAQARATTLQGCIDARAAAVERATKNACAQYASVAVDQQKDNLQRRCGFTGGRWSDNFFGHFGWCLSVGPDGAGKETAARYAALQSACTGNPFRDPGQYGTGVDMPALEQ